MKNIETFLTDLSQQEIKIWVEGDKLRCQAPKGLLTPSLRDQLSERKVEILRFFRTRIPIEPISRSQDLPLSFAQQRLWFLDQFEGASATYNIPAVVRLEGILQIDALANSLAEIVQRHESLRTTIGVYHGTPVQVIHDSFKPLEGWIEITDSAEVKDIIHAEIERPFNLNVGPLLRAKLLKLSAQEHILIITMHHIISDAWSISILVQELTTFYNAFLHENPTSLFPLTIQYADFAVWQRQWLSGEVLETQLNYWRKQLANAPTLLELATDFPRPPVQSHHGAAETLQLDRELTAKLKALSQNQGVTLFMTVLAAFAVLLARYSRQTDIVIGSPIANRTHPQTEQLIGFFVNTLVLRLNVAITSDFISLLQQVKQIALEGYAHQDVPFEYLVEALKPERSMSHTPLFQVMFVLHNTPQGKLDLPGLTLTPIAFASDIAKFDLTLILSESEEGLQGGFEYNTDLFTQATIKRMVGHFQMLLTEIVTHPTQSPYEISLLTPQEILQFQEWNQTNVAYPLEKGVHQLFAEQAERTPSAIAVTFGQKQLTYYQLNQQSNQLANYLQTLGVAPNTIVGLCVERSLEMVIGLLGILKAGGAYLPLDPQYPIERLTFMLTDAQVSILLTQETLRTSLPNTEAIIIALDTDWEKIAKTQSHKNHIPSATHSDLAYLIYTSGSTGQPKGVMIPHRALTNHTLWMQATFPLTLEDKVLQKTPFSFDASVWEFYAPLIVGAQLVIAHPQAHTDSHLLIQAINQHQITILQLVPSLLRILLQDKNLSTVKTLKRLYCGGEALAPEWVSECLAKLDVTLINLYGPTEACIDSTYWQCPPDFQQTHVPIGRPVANAQTFIVDVQQQRVPIGVPGELYIGGAGLAQGYLNRPALTAEKFNLFENQRIYKTGDLARYLPDGNIDYLGRIDTQVKIRGFRIELGEIETIINEFPTIKDNTVIVTVENPVLVAYFVSDSPVDKETLRAFLQARLPAYMVPAVFISLEKLPLTPNGKVDRRTLAGRAVIRPATDLIIAARNPEEELLVNIWCEVLQLEKVGIHDNFFMLGGHSLMATQVIARIRETFRTDLPLRVLFESPTIAELSEQIAQARRETQLPAILPLNRSAPLPLSFAQQRLWFLNQLEGLNATYNMPTALQLEGELNIPALEQSLQTLVQRHEALRTIFPTENGFPIIKIVEIPFQLVQVDLQHRTNEVAQWVNAEAQKPFDLNNETLFRGTLLKLADKQFVLLLTLHHIIADGWSISVLIQEFSTLYESFLQGNSTVLPPLTIQYADFAAWQRQWLRDEMLETQLNYWRKQLAAIPILHQLPTDFPRPARQSFKGATCHFQLHSALTQQLKTLSQQNGVTLFMTLIAAFAILLARYSQQTDIAIGTPIAGRTHQQLEDMVGFFINTLVLRISLDNNPTLDELLVQVRQIALDAYAHQDVPFEYLVEALKPERSMSHTPLFQVMFVLHNTPQGKLDLPGLMLTPISFASDIAKFDLTLILSESEEGLQGGFEYNTDLFTDSTIIRWIGHFQTLLANIVANPQQSVFALPLLTSEEEHQLEAWNQTTSRYVYEQCIHQLFEEQVERTPEAPAVTFLEQQLSYSALNKRANQLAHYLQELGVVPDVLVGLCVERSLDMLIGILGILKAGGAYLPMDPSYPKDRLIFMLEDAQPRVLVTQETLSTIFSTSQTQQVYLDKDWDLIAQQNVKNPASFVNSNHLAYVIYTSGSTGRSKGVLVTHRNVVHSTKARFDYYIESPTRFLLLSSIAFDSSVAGIFWTLSQGGELILPFTQQDPMQLAALIVEHNVSHLLTIPSFYTLLLTQITANYWKSLRTIIVAGEPCPLALIKQHYQKLEQVSLFNEYGPTEATVWCSVYKCSPQEQSVSIPIGRPIANTEIYILDTYQQRVSVGISGELYVGGTGITKGYLNRPELTAEKFVPNPFSGNPTARLYRTGDLARYRADGEIEYLGRLDYQVKLRGFRIELGEIEAILTQYPHIRENVVVLHVTSTQEKYLVAYLTIIPDVELDTLMLRAFLQARLPAYMVPAVFISLEKLPLTPNGKVDRRTLVERTVIRPAMETVVAPRNPEEELLVNIWCEVLKLEKIGIHDNFFMLGGHSLMATQVIARIRETFRTDLPLRVLFESPTIAELSEQIAQARRETQLPAILPLNRSAPLPLSFAQQRLWFLDQLEGLNATYNMPSALQLEGELNIFALEQSLQTIVQRHEALRTIFPAENGFPIIKIVETPFQLVQVDLQHRTHEVAQWINAEARKPFDLNSETLFRGTLLKLADKQFVLLLTLHHIIADGWSIGVLIREFSTLYESFLQGNSIVLPPLTIQYADFAAWQRQWLRDEMLETQLNYWRKQLAAIPTLHQLPTDFPRPARQSFKGATCHFQLHSALTQQLKTLSQQNGVTLFMTLIAAFAILLARYSQQTDIAIGTPIAGRTHQQLEDMVGFFINTLVLRISLDNNPTLDELLVQVRQIALDAYAHQDVPFEYLVEALKPERSMSHTPLFQVMFVLHNTPQGKLDLPGLMLTPISFASDIAKFDLTLILSESEEGLQGGFEYNTDLFTDSTIIRWIGHFQTLLVNIVANPQQSLAKLPLLTEEERTQFHNWNRTAQHYPQDKCIHQLFEEQVVRTPNAIAITFAGESISYSELNQKANQLAHYLQTLGVTVETLVGICVERSLEMIVGLLGILKAGCAYVPLDPNYPAERVAFMLEDSQVRVLLTQARLKATLPASQAHIVALDNDWHLIAQQNIENPSSSITPSRLGYVIYTSGSTGKPKGVAIEHRSVVVFIAWANTIFSAEQLAGVLASTSICFDLSVFEIFVTLSLGGRIILVADALQLAEMNEKHGVTLVNTVPSAIAELVRMRGIPKTVQVVNLCGEPLKRALVEHIYQQETIHYVYNLYGPSEDTVYSTFTLVPKGHSEQPTIGYPITNTQTYILDNYQNIVPIGIPGELHLGGLGLARGYLNRPELTAEKFVHYPSIAETTLYKTGDLVRYRPDGQMEYLRRLDHQIKLRGFRIELGEIETVINKFPAIKDNTVIVTVENPVLVAYFVSDSPVDKETLRAFLQARLPAYMVPAVFISLEKLPLTPNGKVDRRVLVERTVIRPAMETVVAPRNPEEEFLVNIWCEVLKLEKVGIHDNFFMLGGHSLMATQVIARIRETFRTDLPLRVLFESPTIAELSEQIAQARRETQLPAILPLNRSAPLPLSFAQQRLWFLDQLEGLNATYNMPSALQLEGELNIPALEQSLQTIVQRHEALRTIFPTENGFPIIKIVEIPFQLVQVDLQHRTNEVAQWVNAEAQKPFDLNNETLFRGTLLKLADKQFVLLLTLHHIIADGWSISVLIREFSTLYESFLQGNSIVLPPLTIQYADFAAWQRQWLRDEMLETQLNYWRKQLATIPILHQLPTDFPRPARQSFKGATCHFQLHSALTQQLKTLSQQNGVTLFMTLIAAFAILLARYSQQTDIAIGTPIAGRTHQQLEDMVGFFINTLVLRISLDNNPTLDELLTQVRQIALDAYAHQDIPFEQLVEELQPHRDLSHTPLFQILFVLQNVPTATLKLTELTLTSLSPEITTAQYDLILSMGEVDGELSGLFEYNVELFTTRTIEQFIKHFQTLLSVIVGNPHQAIQQIPLLTEAERQQILVTWNDTTADYPSNTCIHQLIEAQGAQNPSALAVVFVDQQLSYSLLNERANQLAHYLQTLGVKPEILVGICIERSLEMIVGILGILKAGGAYVPIDPHYPSERITFMLADAQVSILLTQNHLLAHLPTQQAQIVCLDDDWTKIAQFPKENPNSGVRAGNTAYVIYTSGSTGKPKGVLIEHRSVCNLAYQQSRIFGIHIGSRVLQFTSLSFDVATSDFATTLTAGGTLYLLSQEALSSTAHLTATFNHHAITHVEIPISVLHTLSAEELSTVQTIIVGGEVCPAELVAQWAPGRRFFNAYGPTEATVCTTVAECVVSSRNPPIGRPIANTQVFILDKYFEPTPLGVVGELYIGGVGLARGYLNRPELTAEKFIHNPFGTGRLYKTGDLARYLPEGPIEFIGRADEQIKIRGFRIELGEIEAVLTQYPHIRENAVVVHITSTQEKYLVAYLTIIPNVELDTQILRAFLKEKLPEYMVPSFFAVLDALPITPNGKIDRRYLTQLPLTFSTKSFVAPRTAIEKTLATIWTEVLAVEKVGIYDDFFELGGHSLLALQISSRINDRFAMKLPLHHLFESPTVADLARIIQHLRQAGTTTTGEIIDMHTEIVLDATIQPTGVAVDPTLPPSAVFLTGGTGFLGAFLLYELLQQTNATIYCLVRAANVEEGQKRLQKALTTYELTGDAKRIVPVIGELSEPLLGLSQANFDQLAQDVEIIYHNGALVNFVYPYAKLKAANVLGTQEILRLACQSKTKPVHFVSTLSIFSDSDYSENDIIVESTKGNGQFPTKEGYSQSKWVAEQLILLARERGVPANIYRPSRVTGHSQTGVTNVDDFFNRGMKGCLQLGFIPATLREMTDNMVPVDYVSRAIVKLSQRTDLLGFNFHLVNPQAMYLHDMFKWIHTLGYPLKETSYLQWYTLLAQAKENVFSSFLPSFAEPLEDEPLEAELPVEDVVFRTGTHVFGFENTQTGLAGTDVICPSQNADLFQVYLSYLWRSGFLPRACHQSTDHP